jgi:hypothetical protein
MTTSPEASEREAFERDAEPYGCDLEPATCHCCQYASGGTQARWEGWSARAALRAPKVEAWQPIETAPKDTNVLMFDANDRDIGEAFFDHAESDCWVWANGLLVVDPTHWMPLPATPESHPLPALAPLQVDNKPQG